MRPPLLFRLAGGLFLAALVFGPKHGMLANRAKRRLRELFRAHQKQLPAQCDYLLIARAAMTQRPFPELEKNFLAACTQISAAVAKLPHG